MSVQQRSRQSNSSFWVTSTRQQADCPTCDKTLDVGHAQVIAGLAWWHRAYANKQSAEDQERYESAEDDARLRKWGLWQDKEPVPPWEWRRQSEK